MNIYDDIRSGVANKYNELNEEDIINSGLYGNPIILPHYAKKAIDDMVEDWIETICDCDFVRVLTFDKGYAVLVFTHKYTDEQLRNMFGKRGEFGIWRYTDRSDSVYNGSEYYVSSWFVADGKRSEGNY